MADTIRFDEVSRHLEDVKKTLETASRELSTSLKQELRDKSDEIVRMLLDDELNRFFQEKLRKILDRELGRMIDERIERAFNDRAKGMFDHLRQSEQYLQRTEKDIEQIMKAQQK